MRHSPVTVAELAHELGLAQRPSQPYPAGDLFAAMDPDLVTRYGTLTDDTALTAEDADIIRETWA